MRILIFGPNGSGKGTQSSKLVDAFQLAHVESGGIFRHNIKNGTELGRKAKAFIDKGMLVPDDITIPMILDRLNQDDCSTGWILDGFPRTPEQARALIEGLEKNKTPLNAVITIELSREVCKARLMGRRACPNGHPNNTAIEAISPVEKGGELVCHICGEAVSTRADDVDEAAIDKRHDIYFDEKEGTMAAVHEVEAWAQRSGGVRVVRVDGTGDIKEVQAKIRERLGL